MNRTFSRGFSNFSRFSAYGNRMQLTAKTLEEHGNPERFLGIFPNAEARA